MQDQDQKSPAPEAGDDDAAIWNELDQADTDATQAAPPQGRADEGEDFGEDEPTETTETTEADSESAQADAPTPTDIWASAPPELKAAYEAEKQRAATLEHRLKSDEGRVAAYQRRVAELEKKPQTPERDAAIKTASDKLQKVREEYPEVAEPILEELSNLSSKFEAMTAAEAARQQQAAEQTSQQVTRTLAEKHPDWETVLRENGSRFWSWVEDQPKAFREMASRNAESFVDGQEAAELVGRFKEHLGLGAKPTPPPAPGNPTPPLSDKRRRQLEASAAPRPTGGRATIAGIPEDGDSEAIWKAFDAEESRKR